MKKTFLLLSIFFLTSCQINNKTTYEYEDITIDESIKMDNYVDDNPIKVALYEDNHIVKSYHTTLSNFKEIAVFNIYYTNIELLDSSNIKYNYQKYFNQYKNIDNYKTGFYFTFEADNKKIEQLADRKSVV